jgi:hypothetical protein
MSFEDRMLSRRWKVAVDPPVHGLPGHPVAFGHLGDRKTSASTSFTASLFHHADLHEHDPDLLSGTAWPREQAWRRCQRVEVERTGRQSAGAALLVPLSAARKGWPSHRAVHSRGEALADPQRSLNSVPLGPPRLERCLTSISTREA